MTVDEIRGRSRCRTCGSTRNGNIFCSDAFHLLSVGVHKTGAALGDPDRDVGYFDKHLARSAKKRDQ